MLLTDLDVLRQDEWQSYCEKERENPYANFPNSDV